MGEVESSRFAGFLIEKPITTSAPPNKNWGRYFCLENLIRQREAWGEETRFYVFSWFPSISSV